MTVKQEKKKSHEKSKRRKKKKLEKRRDHWESAETADRHDLYERSVQNSESEIDFVGTRQDPRSRRRCSRRISAGPPRPVPVAPAS